MIGAAAPDLMNRKTAHLERGRRLDPAHLVDSTQQSRSDRQRAEGSGHPARQAILSTLSFVDDNHSLCKPLAK